MARVRTRRANNKPQRIRILRLEPFYDDQIDADRPMSTSTVVTFRVLGGVAATVANVRKGRDVARMMIRGDGNQVRLQPICAPGLTGGVDTGCRHVCLTSWRAVNNDVPFARALSFCAQRVGRDQEQCDTAQEFDTALDGLIAESGGLETDVVEGTADIFDDAVFSESHLPVCVSTPHQSACGELLPSAALLEGDGQVVLAEQVRACGNAIDNAFVGCVATERIGDDVDVLPQQAAICACVEGLEGARAACAVVDASLNTRVDQCLARLHDGWSALAEDENGLLWAQGNARGFGDAVHALVGG